MILNLLEGEACFDGAFFAVKVPTGARFTVKESNDFVSTHSIEHLSQRFHPEPASSGTEAGFPPHGTPFQGTVQRLNSRQNSKSDTISVFAEFMISLSPSGAPSYVLSSQQDQPPEFFSVTRDPVNATRGSRLKSMPAAYLPAS